MSILALVAAAILSQLDGMIAAPESTVYILVSPQGSNSICGALTTSKDGTAKVGKATIASGSAIKIVPHC